MEGRLLGGGHTTETDGVAITNHLRVTGVLVAHGTAAAKSTPGTTITVNTTLDEESPSTDGEGVDRHHRQWLETSGYV